MAPTDGSEGMNAGTSQSTPEYLLQDLEMLKVDEKQSTFLSLPGEIRNAMYRKVISAQTIDDEGASLLHQPPITQVNRQTRAEALSIYYAYNPTLLVETNSSSEWVPFLQEVVDAFTGGPRGLPGGSSQSTLRYLGSLHLDFRVKYTEVHFEADLTDDPISARTQQGPDDPDEVVEVGGPGLDWADAAAVQAAFDGAATRLADDMTRITTTTLADGNPKLTAISNTGDQIIRALEGTRLFALACPQLRSGVCICDTSVIIKARANLLPPWMVEILDHSTVEL
ncbi:hypothetical protein DHEL01_v209913 [Diaporthe helianthi]|uniref:Uncharacterized protein n=1 Tax=Diaporthe helianthi TaxID=158607 RepID=A0A2P5HN52_DIAHE|nr:hypothetical protein DHEL01_v209913 [Diaporthe helianthi]